MFDMMEKKSHKASEQSPDGKNQEKNNSNSVGDAMALSKWVPKSTRCSNVLLQKIAPDAQTYRHTDPIVPQAVSEEIGRNDEQKDQRSRHLQPVREMAGEKEAKDDRDKRDPFPDFSPQELEEDVGEAEEDVRDEEWGEHVASPVRPIQDQQVAACMHACTN